MFPNQRPNNHIVQTKMYGAGTKISAALSKAHHEAKAKGSSVTPELLLCIGQADAYVAARQSAAPNIPIDVLTRELCGKVGALYREYDLPAKSRLSH